MKNTPALSWFHRRLVRIVLASLLGLTLLAVVAAPVGATWAAGRVRDVLRARLTQLIGHPVRFAALRVRLTGLELDDVTIGRAGDETADPARVQHVRVALDWWRLVRSRAVVVSSVDLDGPTVHIEHAPPAQPGQPAWTAQLIALRGMGLQRVGVTRGSLWAMGVVLRDANGSLAIQRDGFGLVASAAELRVGATSLTRPSVALEGSRTDVRIERASAGFEGGTVGAQGTVTPGLEHATLALDGRGLSLAHVLRDAGLAAQIPVQLAGDVDLQLHAQLEGGAPTRVAATVDVAHGVLARGDARLAFGTARARGEWTPAGTTIASLELASPGLAAQLHGALDAASASYSVVGRVTVERAGLVALERLAPLPDALAVHAPSARRAQFDVEINGPIASLASATGTVRARVDELRVRVGGPHASPLELARVELTAVRAPGSLTLRDVELQTRGASASGELVLTGRRFGALDRYDARVRVAVRDLAALEPFVPAAELARVRREASPLTSRGRVELELHATGAPRANAPLALDGRFAIDDFRVGNRADQPPGVTVFPLAITHAEGAFHVHGSPTDGAQLAADVDDLRVQTAGEGSLVGSAQLAPGGAYHAAFQGHAVDPAILRGLIPGSFSGGQGEGTLALEGTLASRAAPVIHGHFVVTGARYELPRTLPIAPGPLAVARFEGDYRVEANHAALSHLALRTDALSGARGAIDVTPAGVHLSADLATDDAGRMASSFAPLTGVFHAGSGAGHLDLLIDPRGVAHGSLRVQTRGGSLTLPSVDASFATHPIESGSVFLGFTPDRITFAGLTIRGPRGNLVAEGSVGNLGAIAMRGRAWLTPDATTALLRPTHFGWLARLVGVRQVASDFTIAGDARGATLHAAIVNTALWQLAGPFIPRDVRNLARGRTRLFIAG